MAKIIAYPFSVLYYFFFGTLLLIFHPVQVLAFRFIGPHAQKKTIDVLNFFLIACLSILGIRIRFKNTFNFPEQRTLIFVSNHQSTYDIPPLIWFLRRFSPKFVAKAELGHGLPSISYHLRNGGNVLIDRKDSAKAITAIEAFCGTVYENRWAVAIFPEGTRTRNGNAKKFQKAGLRTILKKIPDALLVPVSINNSWLLAQWNYFPLPLGVKISITTQSPIDPQITGFEDALEAVETAVVNGIKN
ncbi:MAG: lysophospholipid acyltransferase family protein [Flavobacteriaceae bacterium]